MTEIDYQLEDSVATITLDREEKKNALRSRMRTEELAPLIQNCKEDDDVRILLLRTEGDVFSTGGDMGELLEADFDAEAIKKMGEGWEELHFQLINLGKPTIAVVDGLALAGAANLLLYMDIVIATEDAKIGWSGVDHGIVEWFSSTRLQQYIGPRKAMYLLLTGELVDGVEAANMGLVTQAVPSERLESIVENTTEKLVNKNPRTVRHMRELVYRSMEMSPESALQMAKREVYELNSSDPPLSEGIKAFVENRDPEWVE